MIVTDESVWHKVEGFLLRGWCVLIGGILLSCVLYMTFYEGWRNIFMMPFKLMQIAAILGLVTVVLLKISNCAISLIVWLGLGWFLPEYLFYGETKELLIVTFAISYCASIAIPLFSLAEVDSLETSGKMLRWRLASYSFCGLATVIYVSAIMGAFMSL